jgi:hypothetical protein
VNQVAKNKSLLLHICNEQFLKSVTEFSIAESPNGYKTISNNDTTSAEAVSYDCIDFKNQILHDPVFSSLTISPDSREFRLQTKLSKQNVVIRLTITAGCIFVKLINGEFHE